MVLSNRRAATRRAGERSMGRAREDMATVEGVKECEMPRRFEIGAPWGGWTGCGWSIDGVEAGRDLE